MSLQVLIREEEVVSEDVRSKPAPSVQPGDRAFQKHISKFLHSASQLSAAFCAPQCHLDSPLI